MKCSHFGALQAHFGMRLASPARAKQDHSGFISNVPPGCTITGAFPDSEQNLPVCVGNNVLVALVAEG
jgi:hypothetical protein